MECQHWVGKSDFASGNLFIVVTNIFQTFPQYFSDFGRKKVGILVPMFPLFPNYSVDGQVLPTQQIDNMFKKTLNPGSLSCVSEEDEAAWGGGLSPRSLSPLGHVAWHQSTV